MNGSNDAADQVVRLSIEGLEVAAKITGEAAKNVAIAIYAIMKESNKNAKGKTSLTKLLKTGKELRIFALKTSDLQKFRQEAKRYGVLFCALVDKKNTDTDKMVDIMVRAEDAAKVNRIVERFNLTSVETAKIETKVEEMIAEKTGQIPQDLGVVEKSIEEKIADELRSKPKQMEENEQENPNVAKTEKNPLSEQPSKNYEKHEGVTKTVKKPSVKKELEEIKAGMRLESEAKEIKDKVIPMLNPRVENIKKKMFKERGK